MAVPTVEEPFAVRYGLFAALSVRAPIEGATNMVKREEVGVRSKHSILDLTEKMKTIRGPARRLGGGMWHYA